MNLEEAERALREALEFYADPSTYEEGGDGGPSFYGGLVPINADDGAIARAALAAAGAPSGPDDVNEDIETLREMLGELLYGDTSDPAFGALDRVAARLAAAPIDSQAVIELQECHDTLSRVLANESNHYDRYWTPPLGTLTEDWLDETEAKMREALQDVFCDDAAAVMLTLTGEIRRLQTIAAAPSGPEGVNEPGHWHDLRAEILSVPEVAAEYDKIAERPIDFDARYAIYLQEARECRRLQADGLAMSIDPGDMLYLLSLVGAAPSGEPPSEREQEPSDLMLTTLQEGRIVWFHKPPRLSRILELTNTLGIRDREVTIIPGGAQMVGIRANGEPPSEKRDAWPQEGKA